MRVVVIVANEDLERLIAAKSEALYVDYKAWMDPTDNETKAKLAKHLAALTNHGGGYIIFGVDDETKLPLGASPYPQTHYSEDTLSSIVKRYLDPVFQCRVEWVTHAGTRYPVVIVPRHGARPVITKAAGPQDGNGKTIGVRKGAIYIRAAGPESVEISTPEDWTALLERCLSHRADLLATIMRQAIGISERPSANVAKLLTAAAEATANDFAAQLTEFAKHAPPGDQAQVVASASRLVVFAHGLTGAGGELLPVTQPRQLNERVDVGMHQYAYNGWTFYLPLRSTGKEPQLRSGKLLDEDVSYLEGLRLSEKEVVTKQFDYWRIYDMGAFCSANTYREDALEHANQLFEEQCLITLHSNLAHARLAGQEVPGVANVVMRMDWRGLKGRGLFRQHEGDISATRLADNRFVKMVTIPWAELRDDYIAALRRLSMPFFELFALAGHFHPDHWLTRNEVDRLFQAIHPRMRLFEP